MPVDVAVAVTEGPATQTATDPVAGGHVVVPLTRKLQLVVHAGGFAEKDPGAGVTTELTVPLIVCVVVNAA
jgi:hypothetical protein